MFAAKLVNWKGNFRKEANRGLTPLGKEAIVWLANAGILTDITHMSDQSRKDAIAWMEENQIPPLSTHDGFKPIQNHPRGMEEEDVLRIYQNGGMISLPVSGYSVMPYRPSPFYENQLKQLPCYCSGSIDTYKFTYLAVQDFIRRQIPQIFKNPNSEYQTLTESEKVAVSVGFQTDFNGWVNHHRPRYGKKGCYPVKQDSIYEAVDLQGLAHPGLMASHWKILANEGVDLEPLKRASERFLQLWEKVRRRTKLE